MARLILTGATGFIGGAALAQALSNPSVTTIFLLTRRPIPAVTYSNSPKVHIIIINDFATYTPDTLSLLKDADACIWCMGSNDPNEAVNLTYPLKFIEAMASVLKSEGKERVFRYVHLGGAFCVRDQDATGLWFLEAPRKLRGKAEAKVLEFANSSNHMGYNWDTVVFRPGGVYGGSIAMGIGAWIFGDTLSVHCNELGAAMVDVAVSGYNGAGSKLYGPKTLDNIEIVKRGRILLNRG